MTAAIVSIQSAEAAERVRRLRSVGVLPRRRSTGHFGRRRVSRSISVAIGLTLGALALGRAGTVLGGGPASAPGHRLGSAVYVVQPGDTLWDIAAAVRPGSNVAAVAHQLAALNGGPSLRVGQRLVLP
jgi:hypothetical protein